MANQLVVQSDSTGREFNPASSNLVQDVYKNACDVDPIDISAAGRQFGAIKFPNAGIPFAICFEVVTKSGTTTDPTISIGLNGTDANLLSETPLTGFNTYAVAPSTTAKGSNYIAPVSGLLPGIPSGTPLNVNVVTGSGGTCTVQVRILATEPAL
jgi:hypothetical protein